jgi:hypothetical protein
MKFKVWQFRCFYCDLKQLLKVCFVGLIEMYILRPKASPKESASLLIGSQLCGGFGYTLQLEEL